MRIPASKRVTVGLSIAVLLLLVACAKLYWDYSMLALRTEFAREQSFLIKNSFTLRPRRLRGAISDSCFTGTPEDPNK